LNVVFIMPDQLRPDFLGCYGASFISTPHIDGLAREGILYERAISPSPLCVPARASLLTGRDAVANGVLDNQHWLHPQHFAANVGTWPKLLSEAGFHTEAVGKMHFYPWDAAEGFDHRVIAEDKRHIGIEDDYHDYLRSLGLRKAHGAEEEGYFENAGASVSPLPLEHQIDVWTAREACRFIESHDGPEPFALMVGFPGPHCPYNPPRSRADLFAEANLPEPLAATPDTERFRDTVIAKNRMDWNRVDYTTFTPAQKRKIRVHYAALVSIIDECVGRILHTLRARGLYDDTMIVFASDHGDFLGDYSLIGKELFFEPSIRVPLIVKPARSKPAPAGRVRETVSLTDVFATLLWAADLDPPGGTDAVLLPGLGEGGGRAQVFGATSSGLMLDAWPWKLARYGNGVVTLFDLSSDPHESRNLADDPAAREALNRLDGLMVAQLMASLARGHDDKRVNAAGHQAGAPSNARGWERPYPFRAPG